MGTSLSFAELGHLSDCVAHWLVHVHQLQPGDRVALMLPNLLQFPVVALGVLKARGVLVNINPLYTPYEIQSQLQDSGANLMIVLANVANNAAGAIPTTSVRKVVVTEVGDLLGPVKGRLTNLVVRYVKQLIKPAHFSAVTSLRDVLQQGAARMQQAAPLATGFSLDDLAVLQYTGGTTGIMKGAMLSHR
ncbi:MAG: AMP-binding protein, partial [Pseudomonadota bacterium]